MFDKAQLLLTRVDDCWALFISARVLAETKVSTGFLAYAALNISPLPRAELWDIHRPKARGIGKSSRCGNEGRKGGQRPESRPE